MSDLSIGNLLREARVQKQLTLEDVASLSKVPQHYLLAMELDQFGIIPKDKADVYFSEYAKAVGLTVEELLASQQQEDTEKKQKEEDLQQTAKSSAISPNDEKKAEVESLKVEEDVQSEVPVLASRSSRYNRHEKRDDRTSFLPLFVLTLLTMAILSFVFYIVWQQMNLEKQETKTSYSLVSRQSSQAESSQESSSTSSETNSSSSEPTAMTLSSEANGDQLQVTVENAPETIEITVSLSGAESSWVSVTNTEAGSEGLLLSSTETNSYTTKLLADATSSLITLGVTEGVTVTINNQKVDLSGLTSTAISYVTITIK
ncbi:helix-turn-helix domain-containing protein [Streptococcus henryi]|uniref:helix-turn-helix domain-containing protein n=1 Tax=Streptococcus henryi TaxID=439219 RepID=UPI00037B02FE|nr:helix-turn-helix domain-containing protein [Streptococcus henryi]